MIGEKLLVSAAKALLVQGIVINMKNFEEPLDPPLQAGEFRYGVDPQDGDKVTLTPTPTVEIDKYKLPFIFVAGVLIGAGFGLRVQKVIVIK